MIPVMLKENACRGCGRLISYPYMFCGDEKQTIFTGMSS